MRSSNTVVFCAIDDLIPISGKPLTGFPEFLESLRDAHLPCIWVSARNRHQLDPTLRKLSHSEPFIAEGGSCVYFAEDYFHLKPAHTVRLGRFIAIPAAKPQPAAAEALDSLSRETGITIVPLRSLSLRELIQNTGLSKTDAEAVRQRDFDELFFFAGATDEDIHRFRRQASDLKLLVRPYDSLWSLAIQPSVAACVRELRKLFDRSFHRPAFSVALTTASDAGELVPACDRAILLATKVNPAALNRTKPGPAAKELPLFGRDTWARALDAIEARSF